MWIYILIAVVVVIALWFVGTYNGFIKRKGVVDEAFGRGNLVGVNGEGRLVLDLDPYQIASFVRFDDGTPLTVDEMAVRFRVRIGEPTIGANGFQLREANAQRYAAARYGELRVDAAGEAILVDLRDQYLASLGGPW